VGRLRDKNGSVWVGDGVEPGDSNARPHAQRSTFYRLGKRTKVWERNCRGTSTPVGDGPPSRGSRVLTTIPIIARDRLCHNIPPHLSLERPLLGLPPDRAVTIHTVRFQSEGGSIPNRDPLANPNLGQALLAHRRESGKQKSSQLSPIPDVEPGDSNARPHAQRSTFYRLGKRTKVWERNCRGTSTVPRQCCRQK
jgi:hypothetical protein